MSVDLSDALDGLTARKMAAKERAETGHPDPVLVRLITEEAQAARDWLAEAPASDKTHHWAEANALHMALSPGAD